MRRVLLLLSVSTAACPRQEPAVVLSSTSRVIMVPRWAGSPSGDFGGWLAGQIGERGWRPVSLEPTRFSPGVGETVAALTKVILAEPELLDRTVIVGHSVGCQAAMRALAVLPQATRVRGLICVAGWWSVDQPWASLAPWLEPFDVEATRARLGAVRVFLSDNDPYTANWQQTQRLFEQRLGAQVRLVRGAKHFNEASQPVVLEAIRALLDESPPQ